MCLFWQRCDLYTLVCPTWNRAGHQQHEFLRRGSHACTLTSHNSSILPGNFCLSNQENNDKWYIKHLNLPLVHTKEKEYRWNPNSLVSKGDFCSLRHMRLHFTATDTYLNLISRSSLENSSTSDACVCALCSSQERVTGHVEMWDDTGARVTWARCCGR